MINPDGVRYGKYRTDLNGEDLNRKWKSPDKKSTIFKVKKLL